MMSERDQGSQSMETMISCLVLVLVSVVEALPFPAPNLDHCLTFETCCTATLASVTRGAMSHRFEFQTELPMRTRPAAHLVGDAYIAKYELAMARMKALPDTDGRSFKNQWKLHCLYCDNHLYFNSTTHPYPLEIHRSWLFFPWHRLYVYFHERILARLIDDDTFALPFWNWDNQVQGNVVPRVYSESSSSLYDATRNPCALQSDGMVDFQTPLSCPAAGGARSKCEIRATNAHVMFVHTVGVAATPRLFHGEAYRLGDEGGGGAGALEGLPHGPVHRWVNQHKMLAYRDSAADPIFFAHHANMDRLWEVWKTLPGGIRRDLSDPDYLDTEFTFYDENGAVVTVSVAQALQIDLLRYKYEEVANPWVANGLIQGDSKREWKLCNSEASAALIENTKPLQAPVNFTTGPLTFKLQRNPNCSSGEEVLEVKATVDFAYTFSVTAYAFHPEARMGESFGCGEFLGVVGNSPHVGMSPRLRRSESVMRLGIRKQLELMGRADEEWIVVTLAGDVENVESIFITGANVVYLKE